MRKECNLVAVMGLKVCVVLFSLIFPPKFFFSVLHISAYYACSNCTTLIYSSTAVAKSCSPKTDNETVIQLYIEQF